MTEAQRTHTITWQDPMIGAKAATTMSGLEYLQAMQHGDVPPPPISSVMNMQITVVEEGRVIFTANPAEYHYNPIGSIHGGFAATILDSALGCAVQTTLPAGVGYTTAELHINYLRPISSDTGTVTCEGKIIHSGRRVAVAEARLTDKNDKLLCHATTTCILLGGS